jgi:predicted nucleic acid-binding protein
VLIYLDSNIIIYLIEQPAGWGPRATNRIAVARASTAPLMVSDLTRLECRVKPIASGDAALLGRYDAFFTAPDVRIAGLTAAVCDRATVIRAGYRYQLGGALNLAAAVESACDAFLTNDARLTGFPDVPVEVLP